MTGAIIDDGSRISKEEAQRLGKGGKLVAPKLSGFLLRAFVWLLEDAPWPIRILLRMKLLSDNGFYWLKNLKLGHIVASAFPIHKQIRPAEPFKRTSNDTHSTLGALHAKVKGNRAPTGVNLPPTISCYARAYMEKRVTPMEVADYITNILGDEDKGKALNAFVSFRPAQLREEAEECGKRLKAGSPRSPLEGVPIAVKEELYAEGYQGSCGTALPLGERALPAKEDCAAVAALRNAGALIIGLTHMTEIGIGVTGHNPNHGPCRNPYNLEYGTGGSSAGSGAAVGAGICPAALACDGGGSIRIPAGFCGVYGLKPTWGRIEEGPGPLDLCKSVGHVGPIAAYSEDLAIVYSVMLKGASPDPKRAKLHPLPPEPEPLNPERLILSGAKPMAGKRVGVFWEWLEDAKNPEVVAASKKAISCMEADGAEIVPIAIRKLEEIRLSHAVEIVSSYLDAMGDLYTKNKKVMGLDTRAKLGICVGFTAEHQIQSQRVRTEALEIVNGLFDHVDYIVTPNTSITAPKIHPNLKTGCVDVDRDAQIMKYMLLANLTGIPAVTLPVAYETTTGLPIALHVMAPGWEEEKLLAICLWSDTKFERMPPK
ncbi:hypothetical protein CYMTET_17754, partial [Cymbomonas tetramitiformis]